MGLPGGIVDVESSHEPHAPCAPPRVRRGAERERAARQDTQSRPRAARARTRGRGHVSDGPHSHVTPGSQHTHLTCPRAHTPREPAPPAPGSPRLLHNSCRDMRPRAHHRRSQRHEYLRNERDADNSEKKLEDNDGGPAAPPQRTSVHPSSHYHSARAEHRDSAKGSRDCARGNERGGGSVLLLESTTLSVGTAQGAWPEASCQAWNGVSLQICGPRVTLMHSPLHPCPRPRSLAQQELPARVQGSPCCPPPLPPP